MYPEEAYGEFAQILLAVGVIPQAKSSHALTLKQHWLLVTV